MVLTPQIVTIEILNLIFVVFATVSFVVSLNIVFRYDPNLSNKLQYKLQKQSYLIATIVKFIFYLKLPLFIFFIFTLDTLSTILPGAMCGAGVVNATDYGVALLMLKLLNLYIFGYWIVLNAQDMKDENQRYMRLKFMIFIAAYFLLMTEIFLETMMFFSLDVKSVVDCCGAIFSTTDASYMAYILTLPSGVLLGAFYGSFIFMLGSYLAKNKYLFSFFNLVFLIAALISLIAFFGTYIYEQPTHHCPFCILQADYHYIGYLLYVLLFVGTFYGIILAFVPFDSLQEKKSYITSLLVNFLYTVVVSYFPLIYYFKNGVWL